MPTTSHSGTPLTPPALAGPGLPRSQPCAGESVKPNQAINETLHLVAILLLNGRADRFLVNVQADLSMSAET
jgi:hypothetical protein